ncbi:MAG: NAD(P)/FAD-dependent oxidoreductase [Geobacter sp.]|nr:NAD(P)/FAD-dependent oxidoreductase [Geobacter sp.]
MQEPVTIIGAGPAGLTAAIVLRRHGIPVRVHEMSPDVGTRLSGDFQGFENWSSPQQLKDFLKEVGIDPDFLCEPYFSGTVYAPGMAPAVITSRKPIFYLVRRGPMADTLDTRLKEQALALGAELIFNNRVETSAGRVIVGTGPRSADAIASGITFQTCMENTAAVVFDNDFSPKGYAYLLVHEGHGTLATVMYGDFHREAACCEKAVNFFRREIGVAMRNERQFTSYANFFLRDSQVEGNRLYVGESAGFQDFLWGFGMRYAVLSGYLAARSIIDGTDYDSLWKVQLKPMLQTSLVNRFLLELGGNTGYRWLTRKFQGGNPCDFLRRHYNQSFIKNLMLPMARKKFPFSPRFSA